MSTNTDKKEGKEMKEFWKEYKKHLKSGDHRNMFCFDCMDFKIQHDAIVKIK